MRFLNLILKTRLKPETGTGKAFKNAFPVPLFYERDIGSINIGTDQNLVVLVFRLLNCAISKWIL